MRRLLPLFACLFPASAFADLGGDTVGAWLDAGAGLGAADAPFAAGVGWTAAVGGFVGRYDEALAVGRHWAFGARVRQDAMVAGDGHEDLRTAALLDVHRGLDLLLLSVRFGGVIGPVVLADLDGSDPHVAGGTLRATGAVGWRFDPRVSLQLRVEAGLDLYVQDDAVLQARGLVAAPAVGLTLGLEAFLPARDAR